ncbi:MAG: hypothetical protein N2234_05460 [Planctomycetota bacterium]|nr:hypothetical protein [Planctomycetota bacterium]
MKRYEIKVRWYYIVILLVGVFILLALFVMPGRLEYGYITAARSERFCPSPSSPMTELDKEKVVVPDVPRGEGLDNLTNKNVSSSSWGI